MNNPEDVNYEELYQEIERLNEIVLALQKDLRKEKQQNEAKLEEMQNDNDALYLKENLEKKVIAYEMHGNNVNMKENNENLFEIFQLNDKIALLEIEKEKIEKEFKQFKVKVESSNDEKLQKILQVTEENEKLVKINHDLKEQLKKINEMLENNNEQQLLENENVIREEIFLSSDIKSGLDEKSTNEPLNYFCEDKIDENTISINSKPKNSLLNSIIPKEFHMNPKEFEEPVNKVEVIEKTSKKSIANSQIISKSPTKKNDKKDSGGELFLQETGIDENEEINFMKNKKLVSKTKFQVKKTVAAKDKK